MAGSFGNDGAGVTQDRTRSGSTSGSTRRREAAREAAQWLARIELGTADMTVFEDWRAQDDERQAAFARTLGAVEAAAADPVLPLQTMSRRRLFRAAGAVGMVATLGMGGLATRAYAWSSATSAIGESRMVRLPDGSMARLNTASRLSWRFHADRRDLWVEAGEVALDIRQGTPCRLHGPAGPVMLEGGRYDARLRGEALDLLVMRGAVGVGGGQRAVAGQGMLMPGEGAVVRAVTPDEVAQVLAWQQGEILFQRETLGAAVEEYNRYLTRKITIADRDLANIPVGGRFTSNDPAAFLDALTLGLGIKVSPSQNGFLLTR